MCIRDRIFTIVAISLATFLMASVLLLVSGIITVNQNGGNNITGCLLYTSLISSHILSEISLLADDIGIIDHGALLEEESLAELEQKSSKHIRFTLSDTAQAARILERNFHENHFSIQDDHNLRLHNLDLPVGKIVTVFVENGLEVSEAHTCEESLEAVSYTHLDVYKRQLQSSIDSSMTGWSVQFSRLSRKNMRTSF